MECGKIIHNTSGGKKQMNIFVLDNNPKLAAQYLCDKHISKMLLESCQLLCSAFDQGTAPYRRTHYNHPCSKWVRTSKQNYEWLIIHALSIAEEFLKRYGNGHASCKVLCWVMENYESKLNLPNIGLTPFALAMPFEYQNKEDIVGSYRKYYLEDKVRFAKWKLGEPDWWIQGLKEKEKINVYI